MIHGDLRQASDLETLGSVDWVIDAAANPSVLAGVDGKGSSRQLIEHNLLGTINLLELCKRLGAGFVLISTSRVYSIKPLAALDMSIVGHRFVPVEHQNWPSGVSPNGVTEQAAVCPPLSLYGASKVASETLALRYGETFNFPVRINRCGVLAGAGQFGRPDQGIFAFWINAWLRNQPLRYIGFDGKGYQVRDCLHPRDLAAVIVRQMYAADGALPAICNFSGGPENSMSLAELSEWCAERFGPRTVSAEAAGRQFDLPWLVLDHKLAHSTLGWQPQTRRDDILEEIARHAEMNPDWLSLSADQ